MDKFMKSRYDFDRLYNRRGSNCVKWDSSADENMLPMWVADMDFPAAPAIIDAVKRRAAEGIYGYVRIPDCYYDSVRRWFANRHGWRIENNSDIIYIPGIVPALCTLVNALVPEHKGVFSSRRPITASFHRWKKTTGVWLSTRCCASIKKMALPSG